MAKCKQCGKWGLFLRVNADGLCEGCAKQAEAEAYREKRAQYERRQKEKAQAELDALPVYQIALSDEKRKRRTGYEEVKFSNITPKGVYDDFVVFDTETTGLSPGKDRIIELAAVKFANGVPVAVFETLINPGREIPKEVTGVNHITNEMVANAPTISQVLPSFEEFVGSSAMVAHNLEFDLKFLFYSGSILTDSKRKYYDTLEQAQKLLKKPKKKWDKEFEEYVTDYDGDYDVYDHKLDTLCDYYGITMTNQHRALADTLATGKLFLKLIEEKQ